MKSASPIEDEARRADIPRYLSGNMSPAEQEDFEAWLVANPHMARELELEHQLRLGMASAARRGWLDITLREPVDSWRVTATAASLVGAIALGAFAIGRWQSVPVSAGVAHEESIGSTLDHAHDSPVVKLTANRSATTTPDLRLTVADLPDHLVLQPDVVVLTCDDGVVDFECAGGRKPSQPQYARYELEIISRRQERSIWRSPPQKPRNNSELAYVIHARRLEVGDYTLLVTGRSDTHQEVVGRFWLQIVASP